MRKHAPLDVLRYVATFVLAVFLVMIPLTAHAETEPPPEPDTATTTDVTEDDSDEPPVVSGAGIGVILRDHGGRPASDQEFGPPIPDVRFFVEDEDGELVGEAITDAEGRGIIPVPGNGTYTVVLDQSTLPDGIEITDEAATKTIELKLATTNFVQYPINVEGEIAKPFSQRLIDSTFSGVKFGLIIALAALGLSLIFGTTGLTNFGHGELITFGGIVTWVFNREFGLPVIAAGLIAVILGGAFGWAQDRGIWRPLRHRGTGIIAMMIISIGFGLFLRSLFQYFFSSSTRSLSQYSNQSPRDYGFIEAAPKEIAIIVIALISIIVVCVALMKTRLGKAMRAVSDNTALSASSGLRVDGVISNVWVLGTAITALSGVLLAINAQVNFVMGFKLLLLVFAAVCLGGLGTIWGALIGSMIIGLMVEISPLFGVPPSIKEVGALAVLILILLIRPQGILGRRERIG